MGRSLNKTGMHNLPGGGKTRAAKGIARGDKVIAGNADATGSGRTLYLTKPASQRLPCPECGGKLNLAGRCWPCRIDWVERLGLNDQEVQ